MPFFPFQYLKSLGDNFHRVTPQLYRSAEMSATRLLQVRHQYGIKLMLNLRDDLPSEERAEVIAAGIDPLWVPMRDDAAPTVDQIRKALEVLQFPDTKLVCCKGGIHRTGLICAVYRVVEQNWTKKEAWKEAEKFGWYDAFGHKPLRLWFEQFNPDDFR